MHTQNLFELFTADPVEANMQALKAKLAIAVVAMIRSKQWTQATASEQLKVTQPRMSNLFRGKLDKFSIDALFEMFLRVGYKVEADVDPKNDDMPFSIAMKKAML
jgi:predicted XRE-type DNA-binding protein